MPTSTPLLTCRPWHESTGKGRRSHALCIACSLQEPLRRVSPTAQVFSVILDAPHLTSILRSLIFKIVVYQRQIQKGNLATITVNGSSTTDSSSARFTKEELKDCFTLKEDCDCDTKRKIGKRWPEYGKSPFYTSPPFHHCTVAQTISLGPAL
jgi:hypothetical protein